jgi:hypothetical protein
MLRLPFAQSGAPGLIRQFQSSTFRVVTRSHGFEAPHHAPGKAELGRRTNRDIHDSVIGNNTLPQHELPVYEHALFDTLQCGPSAEDPSRRPPLQSWNYDPCSVDGSWNLGESQRRIEAWITAGRTRRAKAAGVFEDMLFDVMDLYRPFQFASELVHALDNGTHRRDAQSFMSPYGEPEHFAQASRSIALRRRLMSTLVADSPVRLPGQDPAVFREWVRMTERNNLETEVKVTSPRRRHEAPWAVTPNISQTLSVNKNLGGINICG